MNLNNSNEKILTFDEFQKLSDTQIKGRIKVYEVRDGFDNPILIEDKSNLIVLRGRTYHLEKLFNDTIPSSSGYKANLNRQIGLFKIGSGGADIESSPFEPYKPLYSDEDLAAPVPFIIHNPKKNSDPIMSKNPSIVDVVTSEQKKKYYLPAVKDNGTTEYYGKVFETKPQWVFDKSTNEVYKKITLRIEAEDARGFLINELGLVLTQYDSAGNIHRDAELYSRVTFDTISLTSLSKAIIVEYFIYG